MTEGVRETGPTLELLRRILALPKEAASSTQRIILVCYAQHANAAGLSWPSHATVARETGLNRTTVADHVPRLAEASLLEPSGRTPQGVVRYRVTLPVARPAGVGEADTPCRRGRHPPVGEGDTNRLSEPSIEPSLSPAQVSRDDDGRPPDRTGGERELEEEKPETARQEDLFDVGDEARVKRLRSNLTKPHWEALQACLLEAVRAEKAREEPLGVIDAFLRRFSGWPKARLREIGHPRSYWTTVLDGLVERLEAERQEAAERAERRAAQEEEARRLRIEGQERLRKRQQWRQRMRKCFHALSDARREAIVQDAYEGLSGPFRAVADRTRPLEGYLGTKVLRLVEERAPPEPP